MDFFPSDDDEDEAPPGVARGEVNVESRAHPPLLRVETDLKGVGGGRGVFAAQKIAAGTLLLAEIPVSVWPDASSLDDPEVLLGAIEAICAFPDALEASRTLHPVSLEQADADDRLRIAEVWDAGALDTLVAALVSRHGCSVTPPEVLRLALALQHNGFVSGLYTKLTLVNHACRPNCIKFSPTSGTGWASEIWATRAIAAGEEVTICYCAPAELSSRAMRAYLATHHRFSCACLLCRELDPAGGTEAVDETGAEGADGSENDKNGLEGMHRAAEQMERELRCQAVDEPGERIQACRTMVRTCEAMLQALEGGGSPVERASDRCGLLIRMHKLAASAAAALIETVQEVEMSSRGSRGAGKRIKGSVLLSAAAAFLAHSLQLRDRQTQALGQDHPDLAGTFHDLDQAFACMLQLLDASSPAAADEASPASLLAALPYPWAGQAAETRAEWRRCRDEGLRLKRLYSRHPRYTALANDLRTPGDFYLPL